MTDYFALLEQPRRPWLEPDTLKQAFHAKALQAHPDAQLQQDDGNASAVAFTELNQAYQMLQDPKSRIAHLLALLGSAVDRRASEMPGEIGELFAEVAAAMHEADAVIQRSASASSALTRSLLKPQLIDSMAQVQRTLEKLLSLHERAMARLQELDVKWNEADGHEITALQQLYLEFSYLNRWIGELEEKRAQLVAC